MLLATLHWVWCRLWFVIYGLYYIKVCSLSSHFAKSFYCKLVVDFTTCFFCIIAIIVWFLSFIFYVVNHIYWFVNVVPSLYSKNKSDLTMVYDLFDALLYYSIWWYFVEDFSIYVHQGYWLIIFFLRGVFIWFWN